MPRNAPSCGALRRMEQGSMLVTRIHFSKSIRKKTETKVNFTSGFIE
jgi:hypothetical protein